MTKNELEEYSALKRERRNADGGTRKCIEARMRAIEQFINSLPSRYRAVLHLRYIKGYSWQKISGELHYSRAHLFRLRDEALSSKRKALKAEPHHPN
ncbi:MAG: hypothetical protein E7663_04790 [Ruminococcaceae bacterium]|nr:hypothetical protein [Oscillospiraceae bacterium]